MVQDFFLFLSQFKFSFFFVSWVQILFFCRLFQFCYFKVFFFCQTFWSFFSFFVGMLTFGDLDDCRFLGCLIPNEPELIDNFGCNRWF
ncbi:hypothetical protein RhiirB3_532989 [Rhizophagus irregularis]|nr:hypothetical protein RhiirB3_532989 [Rhizophagus irregularis]